MKLGRRSVMVAGLVGGLAGCVGGEDPGSASYMLLDREARESGIVLEGLEELGSPAVPFVVEPSAALRLVSPEHDLTTRVEPGQIALVHGGTGTVELRALGRDVDPDRLIVELTEDGGGLIDQLGAEVVSHAAGRWELRAPDLIAELARLETSEGVVETTLTSPAIPREEQELWRARPLLARSTAPVAAIATAPAAAPPVSPIALEAPILSAHDADYADLPSGLSCADPIEGVWLARKYYPDYRDWYAFTLNVRRGSANRSALTGEVLARSWSGDPAQTTPGACQANGASMDWTVRMPARGRIEGDSIRFGGTSWAVQQSTCGGPGGYNLDQFSGQLPGDGADPVWRNNDGGRSVDDELYFRRISCAAP